MPNRLILKVTKFQLPPPKRLDTVVKNILGGGGNHAPPPMSNRVKDNLFSDTLKHESLQLKMAKISSCVHKKASNMAIRGDIGMFPLNIKIYVKIVK